jgi:hypothetical protein
MAAATRSVSDDERPEHEVGRDPEVAERVSGESDAHPRPRKNLADPLARVGEEALRTRSQSRQSRHQHQANEACDEAGGVDREDQRVPDSRDEDARERRSEELWRVPGQAEQRIRLLQPRGADDLRHEPGRRGAEERRGDAEDQRRHREVPDLDRIGEERERNHGLDDRAHRVGGDHQQPPRQPVRPHAAGQREGHPCRHICPEHDPGLALDVSIQARSPFP